MERRVRLVVALLLALAVGSLAVPLALALADSRTNAVSLERQRQLTSLAEVADTPAARSHAERYRALYGEPVLIVDGQGRTSVGAGGLSARDPEVASALRLALVDDATRPLSRILPWTRDHPVAAATATADGEVVGAALTRVDTGPAARAVALSWAAIVAGAAGLGVLALLLTRWVTRWAMRPVHALEDAARALAHGDRSGGVLAEGPDELRELVTEFNRMADAVDRSLRDQRRLVADTSHQLRNPLAALRLRVDALAPSLDPAGRRSHAALTRELERLEGLLDQLMALARAQEVSGSRRGRAAGADGEASLAEVVAGRVEAWEAFAAEHGVDLVVDGCGRGGEARVAASADVEQALDVLLDNAVRHTAPGTTVTVAVTRSADRVGVTVTDDGPGVHGGEWDLATDRFWSRGRRGGSAEGSGLGLAIAAELAEGRGGSLVLRPAPAGGTRAVLDLGPAEGER
ncbi:sensor histidine kinase [Phycicoccus flavus]|uniref:sensor histidine kinase n=1 Tax=Phycicoccus flavus TaxID=2502783 RepID=UPI000FEB762A|nr:HAMP domain-containing sensor histidine kinase [Phycicoccus flavus]NHA70256.1 HAMP domain-containing histidine kinase [Phycicoccus flavus]